MIDPFTAASGIAGLLSLTIEVSKILYGQVNTLKNAPNDANDLLHELDQMQQVLTSLECFLRSENAKRSSFKESSVLIKASNGFADEIKELKRKVQKLGDRHGLSRTVERGKWYFKEEEHRKTIMTLHRYLGMFQISLTMDGIILLSKSVDDVAQDIKGLVSAVLTLTPDPQEAQRKSQQFDDILQLLSPLSEVSKGVSKTAEALQRSDKRWRDKESQDIVAWLSPLNFFTKQNDVFSRRQEGTGEWLLEADTFKKWLDGTERTLWCPGLSGAGKTVLTSIVVDYLERSFERENVAIAYIYCSYKEQEDQTAANLIASLLQQLVQRNSIISDEIMSCYQHHIKKQTRPTLGEWSKLLQLEVRHLSMAFIIIDALDEYSESHGTRDSFLAEIRKLPNIHLLVTSRHILTIERELEKAARVEIRASDGDIRRYLEGRIKRERRLARNVEPDPALQENIINTIVEKAKGMFLLAQLHTDSLATKATRKDVRRALKTLPKELDGTYDVAMRKIESQNNDDKLLAERVLFWISYARKSLTLKELQHALAVEPGEPGLDEDNLPDKESLASVCAGLVIIDQESNIIRLVHYTTQEYFERVRMTRFPYAQTSIATACLVYISFDACAEGYCHSDQEMEIRMHEYPLLEYAAQRWGDYARGDPEETIKELALRFLDHNSKLMCSNQVMRLPGYRYPQYSQRFPKHVTGLHIAASFGLAKIVRLLLEREGVVPDSKDSNYGQTPLSWAAEKGHEAVVRLLLERDGVAPDSKASNGQTPLSFAAENGREVVVGLLLAKDGVDPDSNATDLFSGGRTPLSFAAQNGHEVVVRLLLGQDRVDPDSKDSDRRIQLLLAGLNGNKVMDRLRLAPDGVGLDSEDCYRQSPLLMAVVTGNGPAVSLLLTQDGIHPNFKATDLLSGGRTPLSFAAENGHEAVVRLLLAGDRVSPDSGDFDGRTPLSLAAVNGHEAVVRLLLAQDRVHPDSTIYFYGLTPLSLAAVNGHEAVVRLLLATDRVDPDSKKF